MKPVSSTRRIIITVVVVLCISLLIFFVSTHDFQWTKKQRNSLMDIRVELSPHQTDPSVRDLVVFSRDFLAKLLPELEKPRLMTLEDLEDDEERKDFEAGGYSFVLRGDFNKDGYEDIAFVGQHDNPENPKDDTFIAIVSIQGAEVVREFYLKLFVHRASLIRVPEYRQGINAIGILYTIASEECGFFFWTGERYEYEACHAVF